MRKDRFASNFSLRMAPIKKEDVRTLKQDELIMPFEKRTVLGDLASGTVDELYHISQQHSIVNGVFDVVLDFGEDESLLFRIDDELFTAYVYTAYEKLFYEVIEPIIGKGEVFAVIHGGESPEGDMTAPFMQLIIFTDSMSVWNKNKNTWTDVFNEFLKPVQQGIVDFMYVTYPNYVTSTDTHWIKYRLWDMEINAIPLKESDIKGIDIK